MIRSFLRKLPKIHLSSFTLRFCRDSSGGNGKSTISADALLSKESRRRFLERIQESPPIGVKLGQSKSEKSFAAVLICICQDTQGEISILYTRRSGQLSRHVRQISFPGGIKDPTDADFVDCALRETEEEIGLNRDRVEIWGTGKLITPPHTAAIMPVIGSVEDFHLSELNINEAEVEEAFIIPLQQLVHPSTLRYTQFKGGFSSPTFAVGQYRIWGVTGFLTKSFLHSLLPLEAHRLRKHVKYIKPFKHFHHH